jgi:uncharacterized protein YidB (DUF937 family)
VFQQLVHDTASQLDLPVSDVASLLRSILRLLDDEQAGGLNGFLDLFRHVGLTRAIEPWKKGRIALGVTGPQLETALGPTLLGKFGASSGLHRTAVLSALTLLLPKVVVRLRADGQVAAATSTAPHSGRLIWTWISWLAVGALLVAMLIWLRTPAARGSAQLTLRNDSGRIAYSGMVPDTNARAVIVTALQDRFGNPRLHGGLQIDARVSRPDWLSHMKDLVAVLQTPGAELSLRGSTVTIGGWLSPADAHTLCVNVQRILGTSVTVATLGDADLE